MAVMVAVMVAQQSRMSPAILIPLAPRTKVPVMAEGALPPHIASLVFPHPTATR